jgi:hypothetical protein
MRFRPASEHDGKTPALWAFVREQEDGGPGALEVIGVFSCRVGRERVCWYPLSAIELPEGLVPLPRRDESERTHQYGRQGGGRAHELRSAMLGAGARLRAAA